MSDAMSYYYKQERLWEDARMYTKMYFGKLEMDQSISKEWVEQWLARYGYTPEEMAQELGIKH